MEETQKPVEQAAVKNPLLDRLRLPGTTFRLPSQGLFYDNGELDDSVRNGEVEVYPMTAMDEVILSTPDKLLSGKAILEVFSRCIPQIKRPEALLARDVDFLMVCLRNVSFGADMDVKFKHDCENAKDHSYVINLDVMLRATKALDPTKIASEYVVTVPNGQRVVLKPLTFGSIIELYQNTAITKREELSEEEAKQLVVNTIVSIVKSVDDTTDKKMIEEWVVSVPLGWKRMIETHAQHASEWGIDFNVKKTCKDCGGEIVLAVTANPISFFT